MSENSILSESWRYIQGVSLRNGSLRLYSSRFKNNFERLSDVVVFHECHTKRNKFGDYTKQTDFYYIEGKETPEFNSLSDLIKYYNEQRK